MSNNEVLKKVPSELEDDKEFAQLHDLQLGGDEIREIEDRLKKLKAAQPLVHGELGEKEFDEVKPEGKN